MERCLLVLCFLPAIFWKVTERSQEFLLDPLAIALSIGGAVLGTVLTIAYIYTKGWGDSSSSVDRHSNAG